MKEIWTNKKETMNEERWKDWPSGGQNKMKLDKWDDEKMN